MSIYATLWSLKFPRDGDVHSHCEWVQVLAQGVLAHVGTPTVGYGYEAGDPFAEFLPPALLIERGTTENALRAVVFVRAGTRKGTPRAAQEYPSPLLVISGTEYSAMSFQQLHARLCDALRGSRPRLVLEVLRPDGTTHRIYEDGSDEPVSDSQDLERLLGSLGYPGFAYLGQTTAAEDPAAVVLAALRPLVIPARVTEALPWVLMKYAHLDWGWLLDQVRVVNRQNRLGFLVTLAKELADRSGDETARAELERVEQRLEDARLVKEDAFRSLTEIERYHLRASRPPAAAHWNVLTDLQAEHLRYRT